MVAFGVIGITFVMLVVMGCIVVIVRELVKQIDDRDALRRREVERYGR